MSNIHTSSTCRVHLVTSMVFLTHRQLIKLSCDMLGSTRICIPVSVDAIRVGDEVNLLLFLMIFLVPIPAVPGAASMVFVTYLALGVIILMLLLMLLRWRLALALLVAVVSTVVNRRRRSTVRTTTPSSSATSSAPRLAAAPVHGIG